MRCVTYKLESDSLSGDGGGASISGPRCFHPQLYVPIGYPRCSHQRSMVLLVGILQVVMVAVLPSVALDASISDPQCSHPRSTGAASGDAATRGGAVREVCDAATTGRCRYKGGHRSQ
jgi:hypothetical protein